MNKILNVLSCLLLIASALTAVSAQSTPAPAQPIPVIDGGLGSCSLELTVTTSEGSPVAAASVKVHIAYRFGGFHKLDLEAGTNVDGKVKFTGMPSRVRRPPLEFHASKDQLEGTATYDPANECQAKHSITLAKPNPQP